MEGLARERVRALAAALSPDISLAIFVVDNATGQVLARSVRRPISTSAAPARST